MVSDLGSPFSSKIKDEVCLIDSVYEPGVQTRDLPFNEKFDGFMLTLSSSSVQEALTLEYKRWFLVKTMLKAPQVCSVHCPKVPTPCKG